MKTKLHSFILCLVIGMMPLLGFSQVQIGDDIDGEASGDISGESISISSDGTRVVIGAYGNDGNGSASGHARVYEYINSIWTQLGEDINGLEAFSYFGFSVDISLDGNTIVIGTKINNINASQNFYVGVYKFINNDWIQLGANITNDNSNGSGDSVSINSDGSIVAIGTRSISNNKGHVRVFQYVNDNWLQIGTNILGEDSGDSSGYSISLNSVGDIVAIGAPYNNENGEHSGHVRIYQYINNHWSQLGSDIDGITFSEGFGKSVSINSQGNIVAIGALSRNNESLVNAGCVTVYENINDEWIQIGNIIYGVSSSENLGRSVSLSPDASVIATGGNDILKIFNNINGEWIQVGVDLHGEQSDDRFGVSVGNSLNGNIVAVGANYNDGNGESSGQVRVYDLSEVLSTNEYSLLELKIYPNPTINTLHIEANNILTSVEIYNLLGQQILSSKPNTLIEEINMSELNSGMYLVKVGIGEQIATYKVLKQ